MARFSYHQTVTTRRGADDCLAAVRHAAGQLGGIVQEPPIVLTVLDPVARQAIVQYQVVVNFGAGRRTRLLGGLLVAPAQLPVRATVEISDRGGRRVVIVSAEEAFGRGLLPTIEAKLRRRCRMIAAKMARGADL